MKKLLSMGIFVVLFTLLVACGGTANTVSTNPNTVRTIGNTFSPTSIAIKKGSTITFLDDSNSGGVHILVVGQDGQQQDTNGTPDFGGARGIRIDVGNIWTTTAWNTAGTYHVTCTVHPTMNLTVVVSS